MDYAKETAREDGPKEGREEGEYNKSLEIAKNLKISGVDTETIATVTGLSIR